MVKSNYLIIIIIIMTLLLLLIHLQTFLEYNI